MRLMELRPSSLLDSRLVRKNTLQIKACLDQVVIKQEKSSLVLQKKTTRGAISKVVKKTAS